LIIFCKSIFFYYLYKKETVMKKLQKNGFEQFASIVLEKENLVTKLNQKQLSILKKTKDSKVKTPQEKAMLTRTINNVHKLSQIYLF